MKAASSHLRQSEKQENKCIIIYNHHSKIYNINVATHQLITKGPPERRELFQIQKIMSHGLKVLHTPIESGFPFGMN